MKFKFINGEFNHWTFKDLECFKTCLNPLPYDNLPDGEYLIRGPIKGHRKEYWKYNNTWYLINTVIKDNGNYYCDSTKYMLFPMLSEKEWFFIQNVGWEKLNKLWQRHLQGYLNWKAIRKLTFDMRLDFYKFEKEYNENS